MSAPLRWHEDAPKQNGEPILPQPHLRWTRAPEIHRNSAPPPPRPSPGDPLPEPASRDTPDTDDISAMLLRAIQDTEIARRLGQPPTPVVRRATPAFRPPTTFLVKSPSSAPSTPLMPSPAASPRRPAPAASSTPAQVLRFALPLSYPGPPQPATTAQIAPALIPPTRAASPHQIPLSTPNSPTRAEELRRLAARLAPIASRISHSATQLSIALWNWLIAKVALTSERTARAGAWLSIELREWLHNTAVPAAARSAQATGQLSIALKNGLVAQAALTNKRTAHAVSQFSTALKQRMEPKPAPVAAPKIRPAKQVPTRRFKYFLDPRHSPRLTQPPLVAWCWAADTPGALRIANISDTGIYLLTDVRWPRGATVPMTLQRSDRARNAPGSWIVADFRILRWCPDGLAGNIIPPTPYSVASGTENCADPRTLKRFVKQLAIPARR